MGRSRPRRVLFRVDASESIGTGHVVRCLALSPELARRGIDPWFASRRVAGDPADQIEASGYPVVRLEGPASTELAEISGHVPRDIRRRPFAALVMDHYGLGAEWLNEARHLATRRLVIDDLADRSLPCELLVNPNLGVAPGDYASLVAPATRLLLGIRFVLLRPSFRTTRAAGRRPAGVVRNVLVTMGGSDPSDATTTAVTAVRSALPTARIEVVLGALYPGEPVRGPGIHVHRAIGDEAMAQLMMDADIAIGAGGTTSWERCALGLPTVILRLAPNQDAIARRLDAAGAAVDAGPVEQLDTAALSGLIRQLADDRSRRQAMSDRAWELVDGRGVERVAHHLDGVRVRRATMADARLLWRWASDPDTRSASFNPEPIPYPDHMRWLRHRLADRSCLLLIGGNGAGPVGQVRFDSREADAEVSISVAPEHRGTVGGLLLESAVRRFHRWLPQASLIARVKIDNGPSRRLFERAGFRLVGERRGVLQYHASALADATPGLELVAER
jgi:UDP-2,4-diacetamido-2,4,6-trideoxy-beta-L-altropyranose hydrolase